MFGGKDTFEAIGQLLILLIEFSFLPSDSKSQKAAFADNENEDLSTNMNGLVMEQIPTHQVLFTVY